MSAGRTRLPRTPLSAARSNDVFRRLGDDKLDCVRQRDHCAPRSSSSAPAAVEPGAPGAEDSRNHIVLACLVPTLISYLTAVTGGPGLRKLPLRHRAAVLARVHPPDIAPAIAPGLPGEGIWTLSETWTGANAPTDRNGG